MEQGIVKRILIRLGEGILVGVGVAIVLGIYNAMSHATDELRKTRVTLEKQVDFNQQLKDEIALRDRDLSRLRDLLVETEELADNVEILAERLRIVEASSSFSDSGFSSTSEFDWSQFQAPRRSASPDLEGVGEIYKFQLQNLQNAIDAMRELRSN